MAPPVLEHYTNHGVLDCVMEGRSTGPLYIEAIERNLVTRLDHAVYLGRELGRLSQLALSNNYARDDAIAPFNAGVRSIEIPKKPKIDLGVDYRLSTPDLRCSAFGILAGGIHAFRLAEQF